MPRKRQNKDQWVVVFDMPTDRYLAITVEAAEEIPPTVPVFARKEQAEALVRDMSFSVPSPSWLKSDTRH